MSLTTRLIIILIGLGALGVYLNRAYARIYAGISRDSTANPVIGSITVVPSAASSTDRPFTYVALGDSLTAGVGAHSYEESYVYQVAKRVAANQKRSVLVVNTAWPGATSADVLAVQLSVIASSTTDLASLLIGVNDLHNWVSLAQFQSHVRSILETLVPHTHQVVVMTLPYLGGKRLVLPPYRSYFMWQTTRYNQALREVLKQFPTVTLVDLQARIASSEKDMLGYYGSDYFHPSGEGYQLWSQEIFRTLSLKPASL